MTDNSVYWVWLQQAFGEGSAIPKLIYEEFPGGVEAFYRAGPVRWNALPYVSESQAAALSEFTLSKARFRLEYAANMGWETLTPECEKYPEALRNISDPPAVLYIKGQLPDFSSAPAVGVAGAREAVQESQEAAMRIGYQLAAGGAIVVSGGAVGVDRCVITGALSAMGQVVSVLPVDLSSTYLTDNADLRRRIVEQGGALVSEYFSQRSPSRGAFHCRNRIISGLCFGVALIQAKVKSGTMIYARHAAQQGREVYVYPGPPISSAFAGSRQLIDDGAKPVIDGEDILSDCPEFYWGGPRPSPAYAPPKRREKPRTREEAPPAYEEPARALADSGPALPGQREVLQALAEGGEKSLGQLEEKTGLPAGKLMALLTRLELAGLVKSSPGKRYRLG